MRLRSRGHSHFLRYDRWRLCWGPFPSLSESSLVELGVFVCVLALFVYFFSDDMFSSFFIILFIFIFMCGLWDVVTFIKTLHRVLEKAERKHKLDLVVISVSHQGLAPCAPSMKAPLE